MLVFAAQAKSSPCTKEYKNQSSHYDYQTIHMPFSQCLDIAQLLNIQFLSLGYLWISVSMSSTLRYPSLTPVAAARVLSGSLFLSVSATSSWLSTVQPTSSSTSLLVNSSRRLSTDPTHWCHNLVFVKVLAVWGIEWATHRSQPQCKKIWECLQFKCRNQTMLIKTTAGNRCEKFQNHFVTIIIKL